MISIQPYNIIVTFIPLPINFCARTTETPSNVAKSEPPRILRRVPSSQITDTSTQPPPPFPPALFCAVESSATFGPARGRSCTLDVGARVKGHPPTRRLRVESSADFGPPRPTFPLFTTPPPLIDSPGSGNSRIHKEKSLACRPSCLGAFLRAKESRPRRIMQSGPSGLLIPGDLGRATPRPSSGQARGPSSPRERAECAISPARSAGLPVFPAAARNSRRSED